MNAVTLMATAAVGGAEDPGRFGEVNSVAAAVAAIIGALVTAYVTFTKMRDTNRQRVSGDERQARSDERDDTKVTLDRWIALNDYKDREIERKDRENSALHAQLERAVGERDEARTMCDRERLEYRRREQAQESALMAHVPWDYEMFDKASHAGWDPRVPPPLRALPPTQRDGGG